MATYRIRDIECDGIVHEVETDATGSALERFERGLERKVDPERFYIEYPPAEES